MKRKKELETQARFRLGSENRSARYCSENERRCRMCQKSEETLIHRVQGKSWKDILNGERKIWQN